MEKRCRFGKVVLLSAVLFNMTTNDNDLASSRLSELLLRGWVMCEDACINDQHSIPMMRSKQSSEQWCVICDEDKFRELGIQFSEARKPPTTASISMQVDATTESTSTEPMQTDTELPAQPQRQRTDQISRLLGEKMLQGWTLLDDVCLAESCRGVPLMRNRQQQRVCVSCNAIYLTEAEAAQQALSKQTSVTPLKRTSSTSATTTATAMDTPTTPSPAREMNVTTDVALANTIVPRLPPPPPLPVPIRQTTHVTSDAELTDADTRSRRRRLQSPVHTPEERFDLEPILHQTCDRLSRVMVRLLERIETTDDAMECSQLASAITSVATALKVCSSK
jgi:uncharacterized Zn finger protein (UPF0148 family)